MLIALLPYMVVFLVFWVRLQHEVRKVPGERKKLKQGKKLLSVVIPLKNEAANISSLVKDLAEQSLDPINFEIIFVDDASSDSTLDMLNSSEDILNDLKILHSGGVGKKKSIALGIDHALGEFIVTTDGDCRVGENWLREIYNCVIEYNADMIIGAVDIIGTGSFLNCFIQLEFLALQAVTEVYARDGNPVMCNGANLCFRNQGADKYSEMVRENISSGDDIFLMESYSKQGKSFAWLDSPSSIVLTHVPDRLSALIKQRIRWTSKSPFYTNPSLILLAALVFLTNLVIAATFMMAVFFPGMWIVFLAMVIIKSIPDIILLSLMARKRGKTRLLHWFLPVQIVYPFYVLIAGLAGIIKGLFSSQQNK